MKVILNPNFIKLPSFDKLLLIASICLSISKVEGQVNQVFNPGFDSLSICPSGYGNINKTVGWNVPKNGGGGNPDLFNNCANILSPDVGVPQNTSNLGFQNAKSSGGYIGIDCIYPASIDSREYVQSKLINKLIYDSTYCVKFFVSLHNYCETYINSIGAYLDSGTVYATSPTGLAQAVPQVFSTQNLLDTTKWMMVEGSFTSKGFEDYITIGNFFSDSNSGVGNLATPSNGWAYYYVDDVSIIDVNTPPYAGLDTSINKGDSVYIGRPPEIGLNDDCFWYKDGLPIDTIAGMWVKPDTTTIYVLQQMICGVTSYDSVTISIIGNAINELSFGSFIIYPNPTTDEIKVEFAYAVGTQPNRKYFVRIFNSIGIKIEEQHFIKNVKISTSGYSSGIYQIQVCTEDGRFCRTEKVVIE